MSCTALSTFPALKGMDWEEWCDVRLCWYNFEHPCKTGGTGTEQQNPLSTPGTGTWAGSGVWSAETLQWIWPAWWEMENSWKLMVFQEARCSGSSGVRKELLWLTLAQCTTLLNSSQGCKQPQAIWVGELCGYFTLTCITGQYGIGIYQLSAEDWGRRG